MYMIMYTYMYMFIVSGNWFLLTGWFWAVKLYVFFFFFFFSSRRRHTRLQGDWSSDVCSSDLTNLQFTGLPFFAPEMFMTVVLKNPLRTKQLQQGLMQLGEEGAIQVFKPEAGGNMLLGAVGQLQFEVVQHRLNAEYDCDIRLEGCQYTGARWITADTPAELREFENAYPLRMARDAADTLAYLCTSPYDVRLAQERFPKIHFHPLREHAGLALQVG